MLIGDTIHVYRLAHTLELGEIFGVTRFYSRPRGILIFVMAIIIIIMGLMIAMIVLVVKVLLLVEGRFFITMTV